jgi:ABC-2 type transport system permease protein
MSALYTVLSVAWKELRLIFRDLGGLAVLFLLPLVLGSVIAAANLSVVGSESGDPSILLKVGLVNQDDAIFGTEVARAIRNIDELDVETFDTPAEAEEKVGAGVLSAAIIIPPGFTDDINAYTPTQVEVMVDPADPDSAGIVTGIMNQVVAEVTLWGEVQYGIHSVLGEAGILDAVSPEQAAGLQAQSLGAIMTQINEMRSRPLIEVISETLEGLEPGAWVVFYIARVFASFSVMFVFFIVGACAGSLLSEREVGTLRRLMASPMPRWVLIAGKMLAYMILACLQVVVLFTVGGVVFKIPMGHSPLSLVVLTLVVTLTAASLGMMVAALARTAKQAESMGTIMGLVLAGLGGAFPSGGTMATRAEGPMAIVARLTPQGNSLEAFHTIMAENGTLAQVLPEIGILLGMSAVFFIVAWWRFKWEK